MTNESGQHRQTASLLPFAAVLLTVVLWASSYPAILVALRSFTPAGLAALRYVIATLALLAIGRFLRIGAPPRADLLRIIAAGALGISAYNLLLNIGETMVSAGTAGLLISVNPVFGAVLGYLILHERITAAGWMGIFVSFVGAAMIALSQSHGLTLNLGALLVLGAALCFALQWVVQKPLLSRHRPLAVATWVIWCGTALLLPFLPGAIASLRYASAEAIAATVFLGLGPAALAYAVWAYALAHYPVGRATSFLYLAPPITLLIGYFALGERFGIMTLAGGCLALAGVVIVNTVGRVRPTAPN